MRAAVYWCSGTMSVFFTLFFQPTPPLNNTLVILSNVVSKKIPYNAPMILFMHISSVIFPLYTFITALYRMDLPVPNPPEADIPHTSMIPVQYKADKDYLFPV